MKYRPLALCLVLSVLTSLPALAQELQKKEKDSSKNGKVKPILVTALRHKNDPFELSRSITVVDEEVILRRNEASILDVLDHEIGVWVEKRTATTSDPVIRGLSGANILALIDGNPITTFWGEGGFAGDDLYGKIEAESISRIEVIRGPASVQYGANALGGVINFITRGPSLDFTESGVQFGGRGKASYETVNQNKVLRFDFETAMPNFRMRMGATWRATEDGEGGSGVGTLAPSGGNDLNFDLNSEYKLSEDGKRIFFDLQQVHRKDLARYYRPTQRNRNDRTGISIGYRSAEETADEGLEGRFYYQWKEDRRDWDNGDYGVAHWQTYSTDWAYHTRDLLPDSRTVLGATLRLDQGQSPDDEQYTMVPASTGIRAKAAPDQDWYNLGIFADNEWEATDWLTVTLGLRYDRFLYRSFPDAFYTPPVGSAALDKIKDWQSAITGGIGAVIKLDDNWRGGASWTRGFRTFAPHFGITKHGYGVLVPSGLLDPVYADNFELSVRQRSESWESSLVGYYTAFAGFQENKRSTFNGQDWYDYNGNSVRDSDENVFKTTDDARAMLYGVEWDATVRPSYFCDWMPEGVSVRGGFMWNYGRDLGADQPMRHTHPARGLLSVGYEDPVAKKYYAELEGEFVRRFDRIPASRLSGDVGYRRNPQDSSSPLLRSYGLPGYSVFNFRCGLELADRVQLGLNVENILNKNYRSAHSRMDAFGTSARLSVSVDL